MRINHNISALNTYRQLSSNSASTQKSLEKLSSGLRINRAGDDAAGLAISEKMRGQIRGLDQASRNAQDGISLIQTAEGALNETHSILQRMRELAVQAGNDTADSSDRAQIKDEMDQLAQEVTRISDTTKFNGQDLMGSGTQFSGSFLIGANEGENLSVSISAMDAESLGVGTAATTTASVDEISFVSGAGTEIVEGGVDLSSYSQDTDLEMKVKVTTAGEAAVSAIAEITINGETVNITADAVGDTPTFTLDGSNFDVFESGQSISVTAAEALVVDDEVNINVTGETDAITGLDVDTAANAEATITTIDSAITSVSEQRSELGSIQNRLEHTINNLGTSSENLTAAESRIRDVDMADEMMTYTKNNILSQAAQSMLAQANQQPQSVLSLLQ